MLFGRINVTLDMLGNHMAWNYEESMLALIGISKEQIAASAAETFDSAQGGADEAGAGQEEEQGPQDPDQEQQEDEEQEEPEDQPQDQDDDDDEQEAGEEEAEE